MFIRSRKKGSPEKLQELADHDLIMEYRETSNAEVIAVLFQRYTHLVYGVSLKYLEDTEAAKDAVMEIFESLMSELLRHDIHNFKSWLHSVTRNHCLMILRKKRPLSTEMEGVMIKSERKDVESWLDLHQGNTIEGFSPEDLQQALENLNRAQRKCIELFYLQGKSYHEVCDLTGFSYKAVKSHLQNGKRNLKIRLEAILAGKQ